MWSWWNSQETVSTLSALARWGGAAFGIAILVLTHRLSTLQSASRKKEKQATEQSIAAVKAEAAEQISALKKEQQRSFTREERSRFIRACVGANGPLRVSWTHGSPEAATFAAEVRGLLEEAGFTATLGRAEPLSPIPVGIQLYCKASSPPQYLRTLLSGLNELGLKVAVVNVQQEPPDLLIGLKP